MSDDDRDWSAYEPEAQDVGAFAREVLAAEVEGVWDDYAEVAGEARITLVRTRSALDALGIDAAGLDRRDRAILANLVEKFAGGPVGLDTLATAVGEDRATLEEVYEPFLIQRGLLQRTSRGRVATEAAYRHLGLPAPERPAALFDASGAGGQP